MHLKAESCALRSAGGGSTPRWGYRLVSDRGSGVELVHLADRLAAILQRYPPESKECVARAREVRRLLQSEGIAAEVVRVTHALLGRYFYTQDGVCFAETGFHATVKVNDLLVDALTGPAGKPQQEYYTRWRDIESNELIFTPMEMRDAPSS